MKIHLEHGDIHLIDVRTRMPFKYGIATMTSAPHAFVRMFVTVDGRPAVGIAADLLPPKWFTKDPKRPIEDEVAEMRRVVAHAVQTAAGIRGESPFAAWQQLWDMHDAWGREEKLPPLLSHFGTSLVERAMIEAVCRALGRPFAELLRVNAFGIRLDAVHQTLRGKEPAALLPKTPLTRIVARHTVGLADPLREEDIAPADRLDDGLPQSLEACIRTYGLRHFKIKVSGDRDRDGDRLRCMAEVIARHTPPDFAFSLDGNEQFHALDEFQDFWRALFHQPDLRPFFAHLLFVEQPIHRATALDPEAMKGLRHWVPRPPLIIDESDGELTSLDQALRLGYAGTSHKNCKGIFKGIANACLLADIRRVQPVIGALLSGEDLANIGPVALLQDLAVCASLGIASVERNGHHYFAGLSMFPSEVQQQVLAAHADLYAPSRDGWPTLTIRDGLLDVRSVVAAPFGPGPVAPVEQFKLVP
jgi:hypothetical protein